MRDIVHCARIPEDVHNWNSREAFGRRVTNERTKTFSNVIRYFCFLRVFALKARDRELEILKCMEMLALLSLRN